MKKILSSTGSRSLALALLLSLFVQARAQSPLHSVLISQFNSMYRSNSGISIDALKDKSLLFRWKENNNAYMAFYDEKGMWTATVVSYEEAGLPKWVVAKLMRFYPQHRISFVNELRFPDRDPVYRVQLENAETLVILQVVDDSIVQERQLRKNP
jgi:hypothetical protein